MRRPSERLLPWLQREAARGVDAPWGGRLVKVLGDGVLLRFSEAMPALEAALDLVETVEPRGSVAAHAGVHTGPVVERDLDVFGGTVNRASRIAAAAAGGGGADEPGREGTGAGLILPFRARRRTSPEGDLGARPPSPRHATWELSLVPGAPAQPWDSPCHAPRLLMVESVRYDRLGSITSAVIVASTAPGDGRGERPSAATSPHPGEPSSDQPGPSRGREPAGDSRQPRSPVDSWNHSSMAVSARHWGRRSVYGRQAVTELPGVPVTVVVPR